MSMVPLVAAARPANVRIGISGWRYPEWRGVFYPSGLPRAEELAYASRRFATIEINSTFYGPQSLKSYLGWAKRTPPGFIFSVKGPRQISQQFRAEKAAGALADFFATGVLRLGDKLGPFLWQFPANLAFDADDFAAFLGILPRDGAAMAEFVSHHGAQNRIDRASVYTNERRIFRHAVEVRHPSFATPTFIELLREHGVAVVCADSPAWPRLMDLTADFIYCRLHGAEQLYISGYDEAVLSAWATYITAWTQGRELEGASLLASSAPACTGRDVYIYFNNTMRGHAPVDAQRLQKLVQPLREP